MCTRIHTYMPTHIHICMHILTHPHTHIRAHAHTYAHARPLTTYTHIHSHMHTRTSGSPNTRAGNVALLSTTLNALPSHRAKVEKPLTPPATPPR